MEESKYKSLLTLLYSNILFTIDYDARIWKPSCSDLFSAKSFTSALESSSDHHVVTRVWMGLAPLEWRLFSSWMWGSKISIIDNLKGKGLFLDNLHGICSLHGKETRVNQPSLYSLGGPLFCLDVFCGKVWDFGVAF